MFLNNGGTYNPELAMPQARIEKIMPPRLSPEEIRALLKGLDPGGQDQPPGSPSPPPAPATSPPEPDLPPDRLVQVLAHWQFELWLVRELEKARGRRLCLLRMEPDSPLELPPSRPAQGFSWLTWALASELPRGVMFGEKDRCCVLLPGAECEQGLAAAQRLRGLLAQRLQHLLGIPRPAISVGLASFPADSRDALELLRMAEVALYQAKWSGGNQVCAWGLGRRRERRAPLSLDLDIQPADQRDRPIPAQTRDLSLKGCSLSLSQPLPPGTRLTLRVSSPRHHPPLDLQGTCVWIRQEQNRRRVGVVFELEPPQALALQDLLDQSAQPED